jgi:hypothetical protein
MDSIKWHDNASISIIEIIDDKYDVILDGDNNHLKEYSTLAKQNWWKKENMEEK